MRCDDGNCALEEWRCAQFQCPNGQHKCRDGSCVSDEGDCLPTEICSFNEQFITCFDGSCGEDNLFSILAFPTADKPVYPGVAPAVPGWHVRSRSSGLPFADFFLVPVSQSLYT